MAFELEKFSTMATKSAGTLTGKILVFGGVYSNFQALQKMQEIAAELQITPSNIICTGDVVGYCAQPEKTVQSVLDWGIHSIAGNVEIQLRDGEEDCGCDFTEGSRCDVFSRSWYPYSQSKLSKSSIDWMHTLPDFLSFEFAGKKCFVVHGSYFETSGFVFKSTPWQLKTKNFDATKADIIFGGHCGLPFSDIQDKKMWLNAGVIGMPANDATTRVWYMVLEENENGEINFEHHSFEYDHTKAADLMEENQLPLEYAHTLRTGLWDNCEILPEEETAAQGIELEFIKSPSQS